MRAPLDGGSEHVPQKLLLRRAHLGEALGDGADRAVVLREAERAGRLVPLGHVALLVHQPGDEIHPLRRRGAGQLRLQLARELAVVVFEQLHCRLAAALPGDALQQLGECLLVSAREQRLAVRAQPVCERWRADPALLTTVDDESLRLDRKSTRLNSSHRTISYAVFCLKKKNNDAFVRSRLPAERLPNGVFVPLFDMRERLLTLPHSLDALARVLATFVCLLHVLDRLHL